MKIERSNFKITVVNRLHFCMPSFSFAILIVFCAIVIKLKKTHKKINKLLYVCEWCNKRSIKSSYRINFIQQT